MSIEEPADSGEFNLDSAMDAIVKGGGESPTETAEQTELDLGTETAEAAVSEHETPAARPPPKSWAKEKHELWSKLPPDAQEYYEQRERQMLDGSEQWRKDASYAKEIKEILAPYAPVIRAANISETDAIRYLMNAHYQLTTGTAEERKAAYERIGAELGVVQAAAQAPVDPTVQRLQQQVNSLQSTLTQRQQAELREAQASASRQVQEFASDPKHAHFDTVASDMVPYINAGFTLADAYERAVWANPTTRAQEQARIQTESAAQAKERAKQEAAAARAATSNNVNGRESRSAPTEPKGKLFDDMPDILKEIRSRAN